jgi:hypothetical protein
VKREELNDEPWGRPVVVEMTIKYVVMVPRESTVEEIDFHRGGSCWCADNDIEDMARAVADSGNPCGCRDSSFAYVREATEGDLESMIVAKPAERGAE